MGKVKVEHMRALQDLNPGTVIRFVLRDDPSWSYLATVLKSTPYTILMHTCVPFCRKKSILKQCIRPNSPPKCGMLKEAAVGWSTIRHLKISSWKPLESIPHNTKVSLCVFTPGGFCNVSGKCVGSSIYLQGKEKGTSWIVSAGSGRIMEQYLGAPRTQNGIVKYVLKSDRMEKVRKTSV